MSEVVASGTVTVHDLDSGAECSARYGEQKSRAVAQHPHEWDEIVEVFERDLTDTNGHELAPEDVARRVAVNQASPATVETLAVDID